jgi:hypothetical protein
LTRQASLVVYTAAIELMRTPAERDDQQRSWARPDRAFFAAGACHILAFRFLHLHPVEGRDVVYIRPSAGLLGSHVYVSDGVWAFDFDGWTPERVVLKETVRSCRSRWPGWGFDRVVISGTLDQFCAENHHRRPCDYAFDPILRADAYIRQFAPDPPSTASR